MKHWWKGIKSALTLEEEITTTTDDVSSPLFVQTVLKSDYANQDIPSPSPPGRWLVGEGEEGRDGGEKEKDMARRGAGVEQNLWQFAFSAGRRSCGGYRLAQKELFVAFARLLYCFDCESAGAKVDGRVLKAFAPGEPFPVRIAVRSVAHERLIWRG